MSAKNTPKDELDGQWPKDGDRLFVEASRVHDARIVRDPAERFYRMPKGYKRAGDILIEQAATDIVDRLNIIYAALFCYRQSMELFLKSLIEAFASDSAAKSKNTHELSLLWERFMIIVKERGRSESIGLKAMQKLVAEMDRADKRSDGFRFATDTKGGPFSFSDRAINLSNLRNVMEGVTNFFECAYLDFSHQDEISP